MRGAVIFAYDSNAINIIGNILSFSFFFDNFNLFISTETKLLGPRCSNEQYRLLDIIANSTQK